MKTQLDQEILLRLLQRVAGSKEPFVVVDDDAKKAMMTALESINGKEAVILVLREMGATLHDCAQFSGVKRDRIRLTEARGLRHLRRPECMRTLEPYVS